MTPQTFLEGGNLSVALAVLFSTFVNFLSFKKWAKHIDKTVTRLELLNLLQHSPKKRDRILGKWDEYKAIGGNSYIDLMVEEWKESEPK